MSLDEATIGAAVAAALEASGERVAAVYLFGSQARGTAGPRSDVDLGVILGRAPEPGLAGLLLDLEGAIELRLGRSVDAVVLDRASPDLVHEVLREGRLLAEPDPSARVRFEVDARNRYFDLEPVRRAYRRPGP